MTEKEQEATSNQEPPKTVSETEFLELREALQRLAAEFDNYRKR
ncbi:MAG: nucleotide exchange factor GrpE, partial [Candidatus Diapherotrites archaeon]|nr:nucleotide exchange factor GrpE [Candidatus Diapherotrites archaeon]